MKIISIFVDIEPTMPYIIIVATMQRKINTNQTNNIMETTTEKTNNVKTINEPTTTVENINVTNEHKTSFNADTEQRELTVNVSFDGMTIGRIAELAAKYVAIQFQRALRTSFDSETEFDAFFDEHDTYNVHAERAGHKIETRATRIANMKRLLSTLPDDERAELLKKI